MAEDVVTSRRLVVGGIATGLAAVLTIPDALTREQSRVGPCRPTPPDSAARNPRLGSSRQSPDGAVHGGGDS